MIDFKFILFADGSWCYEAHATEYLKGLDDGLIVTGETTLLDIANHLDDEKMTGEIIGEMLG